MVASLLVKSVSYLAYVYRITFDTCCAYGQSLYHAIYNAHTYIYNNSPSILEYAKDE